MCLLHCGPTGTEALKNLVLGGIASFTLVDGGKVTTADLANKCAAESTPHAPAAHAHKLHGAGVRPRQLACSLRRHAAEGAE